MKKIVLILIFYIGSVYSTSGPAGDIKGKIVDAETKQPLTGVNIIISGTEIGTTTDARGAYILNSIDVGTYKLEQVC